jgi:UDP-3-O-[3-hydroxymyristoyl] N-acetylglucosamine deacetylase
MPPVTHWRPCGGFATFGEFASPVTLNLGSPLLSTKLQTENTIAAPVEFRGVGLHSGAAVNMRLLPAASGTGIVFRRTDLDNFAVEATGRNVARVSYATSLMKNSVLISTTEHLLSAAFGAGVDNLIVELDNLELPILDGSALPFVEGFAQVGLVSQRRRREYLRIIKPIIVEEKDKLLKIEPADSCKVSYEIEFPTPIGHQSLEIDLTTAAYNAHIAPARTFGYKEDEAQLRNMGLIRGVSESSAIILTRERVLNGPLRFSDEFVRHKILDLIGDLALAGHRILGHITARRAGHAMHTALVSRLLRDRGTWELVHLPDAGSAASEVHRRPHLVAAQA